MRELLVLLLNDSASKLVTQSIELQKFLSDKGYEFKINYQSGSFAQFVVETNLCATHLRSLVVAPGLTIEVRDESLSQGNCHECQTETVA